MSLTNGDFRLTSFLLGANGGFSFGSPLAPVASPDADVKSTSFTWLPLSVNDAAHTDTLMAESLSDDGTVLVRNKCKEAPSESLEGDDSVPRRSSFHRPEDCAIDLHR
jgi:hypothetical protein